MSYEQNKRSFTKRKSDNFPIPVEAGKEYTVDITDMGRTGDGLTRIQGFVIFVKDTKPGDKNVKIKINTVADSFATAQVAATSPSDNSQVGH